ncbi:MOSC domain-containing protein [Candidatus Pelagibacter sp.]|nr:MOSC domain-containing protein [Candidatus Pelagibacter sp.]
MTCLISSINYSPVKSLSFESIESCEIKKDSGILNDRMFAFSRIIDLNKAQVVENNPNTRSLNNFLTLKNSPVLNKYNFTYKEKKLALILEGKELISVLAKDKEQRSLLANKLIELESSLITPISLLKNSEFPFFDTTHTDNVFNSISLINLNSVEDFGNKINKKVEPIRFRGNLYVKGVDAWQERNWIGKTIKINNLSFKVERHIPRCVAINLKPKTDDNSLNLLQSLKKNYNHFDMGIYLRSLNDGKVTVGDKILIDK